jgi:asparagine synthase (glutamine-hydrolysing)
MSGIYGIYRYDGAPVDSQWLDRMRVAMAFYGPHGGACKIDGPVGLGHLLLEVNPEDAFEKQPMRGDHGLLVSAARLDNRDALLEAFLIPSAEAPQTSDGHLVSLAFDRWGEDLCPQLEGDWTLAAWDARTRRLLLAKDALGNATMYYHEGKGFFAFATSLKALLALPGVVKEPDRMRLAQVLVGWQQDGELTSYKGFRRILWAHAMTVAADGQTRSWRYWSPESHEPLAYRRDEDYVEAFLEHYERAVESCLRTRKPISVELSGGRDSGSVVALAAPLLAQQGRGLTAYTSVPLLPPDGASGLWFGNEWDQAHATATMAGANVRHLPIDASEYGMIQSIESSIACHEGPGHASVNSYWLEAIMKATAENGSGVLLSGQMGNATVSWEGNGYALLALLQGQPAAALRLFLHSEPNLWLTVRRQIIRPLLRPPLNALRRRRTAPSSNYREYSALNPNMAAELALDSRMRAAGWDASFEYSPLEDGHPYLFAPMNCIACGIGAESAARYALCSLDPTANLALTEFLLRVPDNQFRNRGQSSWLYQRAFRDRLPAPVVNGDRKGLQAADAGYRILRELPAFRDGLQSLDSLPTAREMLDMPLLHRCLDDLVARVDRQSTANAGLILLRGLGVGLFLRRCAQS